MGISKIIFVKLFPYGVFVYESFVSFILLEFVPLFKPNANTSPLYCSGKIFANDCITADAYGTECIVLGVGTSLKLLKDKKLKE